LGCLRTAFTPNANRPHPNLGSDTPVFPIFTKKVEIPIFSPLEPRFPCLRTEIDPNAVRRPGKLGCGGRKKRGEKGKNLGQKGENVDKTLGMKGL